uniref:PIN domain-containing protein n=1 Tax=Candidatus Kentrum sp. FW TaxID=2126338 RepID=A0A450U4J6_9GAMM|nr:MAG: hypothetical protein BECKFW1821C_GA0114237_12083 [Candidatus Kentron sp. FW]
MTAIVYIETSVISYLCARPSRDLVVAGRQSITSDWWESQRHKFDLRISVLVEDEMRKGDVAAVQHRVDVTKDIPSLLISEDAVIIANLLLAKGAIPKGSKEDALHIGIAAAQGADFLLTWNFKHINNAQTKAQISKLIESLGFVSPMLCSPEELGGLSDD